MSVPFLLRSENARALLFRLRILHAKITSGEMYDFGGSIRSVALGALAVSSFLLAGGATPSAA